MGRILKIALGAAGVLVAVFVLLVVVVAWVIEPDDYRPLVQDAVSEGTGRDFQLDGPLSLDWWPCCSIALGPSRLGNPAGFPDGHFVRVESAGLRLALLPLLLRGEVEIDAVTLEGVDVALVALPDGRDNWTLEPDSADADPAAGAEAADISLRVDGIELRGGRVSYQGPDAASPYVISDLTLSSGVAIAGDELTLDRTRIGAVVTAPELPEPLEAQLATSTVAVNLATLTGRLQGLQASARLLGARLKVTGAGTLDGESAALAGDLSLESFDARPLLAAFAADGYRPAGKDALGRVSLDARWSADTSRVALEDLKLAVDATTLSGRAAIQDLAAPAVAFALALDDMNLDGYLPAEAGAVPAAPAAPAATEVPLADFAGIAVDGTLQMGRVSLSGLTLTDTSVTLAGDGRNLRLGAAAGLGNGRVTLQGAGPLEGKSPHLAGTLDIQRLSPRAVLATLGAAPATANPAALDRFEGRAAWRLTPRSLALSDLSWQLDDSRITGQITVTDLSTAASRFDLAVDRLDVDGYLAPDTETSDTGESGAAAEIPVELIRPLNLNGRLTVQALTLLGLKLSDAAVSVTAADGVLRLDPIRAGLYGGRYEGRLVVDATGPEARLSTEQSLSAVQVGEVLGILYQTDRLGGAVTVALSGSGTGNRIADLLRGLSGQFDLSLADGVFRGMDLGYELQSARARLRQEAPPPAPEVPETRIRTFTAAGRLADGVLGSDRLLAEAQSLRLEGNGGVNLLARSLDLNLAARVKPDASGKLAELSGIAIPLTVQGSLLSPQVGVDLKGLVTGTLREQVKDRARDALLERLGDGRDADAGTNGETAGAAQGADAASESEAGKTEAAPEPPPESAEDLLKRRLRDLIKKPQSG